MSDVDNKESTGPEEEFPLPDASFDTLVRSLVTQVQFALLSLEGEGGKKHEPDLRVARHYIDMLAMLEEKTRGNLTLDERRLLENSLTELRFRYVQTLEETRKKAGDTTTSTTESARA